MNESFNGVLEQLAKTSAALDRTANVTDATLREVRALLYQLTTAMGTVIDDVHRLTKDVERLRNNTHG